MSQVARIPGGRSAKVPLYGELTEVGLKRLVSRFSIRFKDLLKDILRRYSASLWKETVADKPSKFVSDLCDKIYNTRRRDKNKGHHEKIRADGKEAL